jgi:predicted XRE-type DNA-binding protein
MRYTDAGDDYIFSDNFFRAQYNFINDAPANVDENELLIAAIEYKIKLVQATVVIIDNITCLRGGTENAAVALSLMKNLKALKNDHKLSILVLAHTPKRRKATQPITADDLHGSKLLINFADSAFAISKSNADKDLCYLKQIKQRNTRQRYGDDNVCRCRIHKPGNFLHFKFEGNSPEHNHLVSAPVATRQQLTDKIAALAAGGVTQRDISEALNIPLASVNRLINKGKSEPDILNVNEYLAAYSPESKPEFIKPNTFEIIIPIDNGSLNGDAVVNDSINDTASNTINEAAEEPADDGVKERLLSIVRAIHKNPGLRPDIIANAPGIDVKNMRRDIKMLAEAGIILFKGPRKTGGYFIGEEYEGRFKE